MLKPGSQPLDRLYFALMAGIGFFSSAIILAALYLLTSSFDQHGIERGNERLALALNNWTETLITAAEDLARGDVGYDALAQELPQTMLSGLRSGAQGGPFDWLAVLDQNGQILHAANLPQDWDARAYFASQTTRPLLDSLVQNHPADQGSVGGVFAAGGTRFLAALTRIAPDNLSGVHINHLPYLVGGRDLNAEALDELAARVDARHLFFQTRTVGRSIAVEGPLGAVGNLGWQATLPGWQFRQVALPWVLAICSVLMFMTSWMSAHFRKMVNSLEELHRVATTDHLTGIANRAALTETLQSSLVREALRDRCFAVISLDLNDFKQLNDEHGHHAGDRALKIAAERIRQALPASARVFRMGGDEFLCLVFDHDPEAAAKGTVDRLKSAFSTPMDLCDISLVVTPSIGVAIAKHGENWDAMLERSDADMYREKRRLPEMGLCVS